MHKKRGFVPEIQKCHCHQPFINNLYSKSTKNCRFFILTLLWPTVKPDWVDLILVGHRYSLILTYLNELMSKRWGWHLVAIPRNYWEEFSLSKCLLRSIPSFSTIKDLDNLWIHHFALYNYIFEQWMLPCPDSKTDNHPTIKHTMGYGITGDFG